MCWLALECAGEVLVLVRSAGAAAGVNGWFVSAHCDDGEVARYPEAQGRLGEGERERERERLVKIYPSFKVVKCFI